MTDAPATNELLPCPFCGGVASMEQTESNRWSVGCDAADEPACMGYQSFTTFARRSEATKAWNTRAAATPSAQGRNPALAQLDSADARSALAAKVQSIFADKLSIDALNMEVDGTGPASYAVADLLLSAGLLPDASGKLTVPFNPCLAKLRDDEPFFVLLGRDKQAPIAVIAWADAREQAEGKSEWTDQAREVAATMAQYSGIPMPDASPGNGAEKYCERREKCQEGIGICHCEDDAALHSTSAAGETTSSAEQALNEPGNLGKGLPNDPDNVPKNENIQQDVSLALLDDLDHEHRLAQEQPGGVITSAELLKRAGADLSKPFVCGPFPPEMRMYPPETFVECEHCGGEGSVDETIQVYENGCGFSHPDVYTKPCTACNGAGGGIQDAVPDEPPMGSFEWYQARGRRIVEGPSEAIPADVCQRCQGDGFINTHANLPDVPCPSCSSGQAAMPSADVLAMKEACKWRYEIQHGPDGETNYAWVYDESGNLVCSTQTHYAVAIVQRAAIDKLPPEVKASDDQ